MTFILGLLFIFLITEKRLLTKNSSMFYFSFIFQLSGEVILQIANEPVLPMSALDVALEVQNSLKGKLILIL